MPTAAPTKPSKKAEKAIRLFDAYNIARQQLHNHRKIANSPLPKHKVVKHRVLVTLCIVRLRNAASEFDAHYRKLGMEDKMALDAARRSYS